MEDIKNMSEQEARDACEKLVEKIAKHTSESSIYGEDRSGQPFCLHLRDDGYYLEPQVSPQKAVEILTFILQLFEPVPEGEEMDSAEDEIAEIVNEIRQYEPQGKYNITHPSIGTIVVTIDDDGYFFDTPPDFDRDLLLSILELIKNSN